MEGELDKHGMLFDFADFEAARLRTTSAIFDHQLINDLKPFDILNPSAENIARFIFDDIQRGIEPLTRLRPSLGDRHVLCRLSEMIDQRGLMSTSKMVPIAEYLGASFRPDRDYIDGVIRERNLGEWPHSGCKVGFARIFFSGKKNGEFE